MTMRTIFENGRFLTGRGMLGPRPETAGWLLVEGATVTAVGTATELPPAADERVDLGGAWACPGFNDAHLHLGEGARLRREVNLLGADSLAETLERIARATARAPGDAWLTGGGWDESRWPEQRLPSRHDLDRVTGGRPAVFARVDVHVSVANSAALAQGNVGRGTAAPPGSGIDRDGSGEPTGILRERPARALVEQHIPPVGPEARIAALLSVLQEAAAHGITSVQDYSVDEDFAALTLLHAKGDLPVRVSEWLPFDAPVAELEERQARAPQTRWLRTGMLKAFLDGSLGSRTAAMLEPYTDAPGEQGLLFYETDRLRAMALERAGVGFALGFHAIGDRALRQALEVLAAVRTAFPHILCRVEHAQTAAPDAFAEARAAGVVASMQPVHWAGDRRWARERLGPDRLNRAYAWRRFEEAGVPLAFGTDFPVEPLAPLPGIHAAITREGHALSAARALHAYTQGSALAEGADGWKGLLAPGYAADFCVLDRDLLACTPEELLEAKVLRTVAGGRTTFLHGAG